MKKYIHKGLLQDLNAPKTKQGIPFFIRDKNEKAYAGFPLIHETETNGFIYGAISNFLEFDTDKGCQYGDGFIEAPDGTRAGLVWGVSGNTNVQLMSGADEKRWGIYAIDFPKQMKTIEDLVYNFREVLPYLIEEYNKSKNKTQV
ncbi:MAG TPA: hypothetical protein VLF89_05735 [Candidatus Saccharimonadales bacterium]|nr:hypothetical protein [Candidatus Saccharimonadales bacterium]